MAMTSWQLSGDYFETCSCDYVCPCLPTNMAGQPTKGYCNAALVFHIEQGRYGNVVLDSLNFAVVLHTPSVMSQGNWSVGVILDERANPDQQQALTAIASGQAGGPMAPLGALIGTFLGTMTQPIQFQKNGLQRSFPFRASSTTRSKGSKALPIPMRRSISTTCSIRPTPARPWPGRRTAACMPSASIGTRPAAATTVASRRFIGRAEQSRTPAQEGSGITAMSRRGSG